MKKTFLASISLFLAVIMMFGFSACDSTADPNEDKTTDGFTDKQTETPEDTTQTAESENKTVEVILVENGDSDVKVSYSDGLAYTATGYLSANENASFTVNDGLVFTFTKGENFKCNRFILTYSSEAPVEIEITYKPSTGGKDVVDNFFLEAADHGTFKGLVSGYLKSHYSNSIIKMTVSTCEDKETSFSLHSFTGDSIDVIRGDTCYIENDRFKLGVKLSWGGGINYIKDKTYNDVSGLTNLVNQHDTGRLIQQSYYGTDAIPGVYESGSFDGKDTWPYNPVQGGDKYGNKSRLVDLEVTENSIYVKAQPQDWAQDGKITPSYMENVYKLTDDYIEVDNRFVDFSGWTHTAYGQELPAFYTVSYLDTYYFYNGEKPWTGDELTVKPDLPFWGNTGGDSSKCNFYLRNNNSETWSAWVNGKTNWGIGLYTPNIDRLKAGRHEFNGSKDANNNATNYIAAYNKILLTSFVPVEYSYLITTGTVEEIREVFTENKDFADNASLNVNRTSTRLPSGYLNYKDLDFTDPNTGEVFYTLKNTKVSYDEEKKATVLTATGSSPYATIAYMASYEKLLAENYTSLVIEYMVPTTNKEKSSKCIPEFYVYTGSTSMSASQSNKAVYSPPSNYVIDGEYHRMEVPLSSLEYWSGDINRIRFDFFSKCSKGDMIYIKSISLK